MVQHSDDEVQHEWCSMVMMKCNMKVQHSDHEVQHESAA